MQVTLDWKNGLSFEGSAPDSDFKVNLNAEDDGSGEGVTPMQVFAMGLGGCTGIDVISILQKKRQAVSAMQIRVTTKRVEEHPRVWTHALIEYFVTGKDIDPAAVERAIQLSKEKYCPAQAMMRKAVEIETRYEIKAA